jgi:hypothetical protein
MDNQTYTGGTMDGANLTELRIRLSCYLLSYRLIQVCRTSRAYFTHLFVLQTGRMRKYFEFLLPF